MKTNAPNRLTVSDFKIAQAGFELTCDDFDLEPGETLSIEAPSGFGKTSFLRALMGLSPLLAGQITLGGDRLDTKAVHLRNLGVVFQDHLLFPHLNAFQNAVFGLKLRKRLNPETETQAREAFQKLGLENRMFAPIQELSGGERQRVALLRATLFLPSCLILDEPLKGLDAQNIGQVMDFVRHFIFTHPLPVIWVSHQGEDPLKGVRIIGQEKLGRRHFEFHRQ